MRFAPRPFGALPLGIALGALAVSCSSSPRASSWFQSTTPAIDDGGAPASGDGTDANANANGDDDGGTGGPVFAGDGATAPPTSSGCVPDPANYDIPGNNCDDDGDGQVDNVTACDAALTTTGDAYDFARALGLCQKAENGKWGVVSAAFTNGYGSTKGPADGQHGILPKFGDVVKPREGAMLGVLSSGWGREYDGDTGFAAFKGQKVGMQSNGSSLPLPAPGSEGGPPPGYPKAAQGCPTLDNMTFDLVDLQLEIRVPKNAKGLKFDFDFWSGEWPEYVCSAFNDSFIAYLRSNAFNGGQPENISFDAKMNPVSVNNGFFDRCTPGAITGCSGSGTTAIAPCPGGTAELVGTGFLAVDTYCTNPSAGGGATGWLTSQAPVEPGEKIQIELMIWDTGDASFDSSVLFDNFGWTPVPVQAGTQRPPK